MAHAQEVGEYFRASLHCVQTAFPKAINEVRGLGLMIGIEFAVPIARTVLEGLFERGIVSNAIGDTVIRLVPPLVVTKIDCDKVATAIHEILSEINP